MSKKRVVKFQHVEFKNDWSKGPRINFDHDGTAFNKNGALESTSVNVKDEWAAVCLLNAARAAVKWHLEQARSRVKTLVEALEGRE